MTKFEKDVLLEVLTEDLDISELPDEALSFLREYLMTPSASGKVSVLLAEIDRLYNRLDFQEHYEHVGYKTEGEVKP